MAGLTSLGTPIGFNTVGRRSAWITFVPVLSGQMAPNPSTGIPAEGPPEKMGIWEPENPGAVNPGAVNPGAVNPGAVNPGAVNPGAVELGTREPKSERHPKKEDDPKNPPYSPFLLRRECPGSG